MTYSVFLIATLVLGIPSNYIIVKIGIRRACILSAILFVLGCITKLAVIFNPKLLICGQILIGFGYPLSQNGIYKYSRQSFQKKTVV